MRIIEISNTDRSNDEILINIVVDSVNKEREKFGKDLDGEDYKDNCWLVCVGLDSVTGETNWLELYYISNMGLVRCEQVITEDEEKYIEKYIEQNAKFI